MRVYPKYIASDGSFVPISKGPLRTVFPREDDFTIYSDSTPLGYGLLEAQSSLAIVERGGFHDVRSADQIRPPDGCLRRQLAHISGARPFEDSDDTMILTEQSYWLQKG